MLPANAARRRATTAAATATPATSKARALDTQQP
jgi:hypothetical protein